MSRSQSALSFVVVATALAVAALLLAERRGQRAGVWVAKPLASTGFVALALLRGAADSGYGRWVLAALVLGWLGDVLLIPKGAKRSFAAGLGCFLLGHLAFAGAFLARGVAWPWLAGGALAVGALAVPVLRWLSPHVPGSLRGAVYAYVAVISAMVAAAAGSFGAAGGPTLLAGALGFFASDLAVARERFVTKSFANKLWGLPLYYGSQLLLASTAGAGGAPV
jgi:uncharacterized membrane protein YhhN